LVAIRTWGEIGCVWFNKRDRTHLDVAPSIETVKLIHDFKHGALHLIVAALTVVKARATNAINFIKKDEASFLGSSQLEHFAHHTRALANIFLHEFRPHNSDEARVGAVGAGTCR
jgi:hypothetical protein